MSRSRSFLSIIEACDNFSVSTSPERLVPFLLTPQSTIPIGFLRPPIIQQLQRDNSNQPPSQPKSWHISLSKESKESEINSISFSPHIQTFEARSVVMKSLCERLRDEGFAAGVIGGRLWRNELYVVYNHPFKNIGPDEKAFVLERVCCELFGVVTYGVHMTAYVEPLEGEIKIWVPKRASTKQTWPGFLDNTVAGGIPDGITPRESMVKECMEEASLPEDIVKSMKSVGQVSYFAQTDLGWLQPEFQYVFDLRLPDPEDLSLSSDQAAQYIPKPLDGEVESFQLLPLSQVVELMFEAKFKRNCAVVLVDFLVRHGYITPETEPNYLEIATRLHGRFGFDTYKITQE